MIKDFKNTTLSIIISLIIVSLIMTCLSFNFLRKGLNNYFNKQKYQKFIEQKLAIEKTNKDHKINVEFNSKGINNIALITMIKNEEDIIFENLVWHFSLGFRKFIIVNNLSTDYTQEKIEEFIKLTKNKAIVILINDPIYEYIQTRILTGAYDFARSVWPELQWIFPVDADEFWVPKHNLEKMLNNIPDNVDAIAAIPIRYYATPDFFKFDKNDKFYEKIHYHTKYVSLSDEVDHTSVIEGYPKSAIRSQPNIVIQQGNHYINRINNCSNKKIQYIDGRLIGLEIYEYSLRSIEHTSTKLTNGMKVNNLVIKLGIVKGHGAHWSNYETYISKYGEKKAAEMAFKDRYYTEDTDNFVDESIPIKEAIIKFYEIINDD